MSSILKDLFCAQKQAKKANYTSNDFYGKGIKTIFVMTNYILKFDKVYSVQQSVVDLIVNISHFKAKVKSSLSLVPIARHSVFPTVHILQSSKRE